MTRPMTRIALTSTIALAVMLAACNKKEEHGEVAATVNGVAIYQEAVDKPLESVPAQLLQGREAQIRQQVLDQLIQRELIKQEAKRIKLAENPDFREQMENMEDQLTYNFVLKQKLDETLTPEKLKAAYEATKQARAYPAVKASHILVKTEQEAKDLLKVVTPQNFAEMAKEKSVGPSAPNGGELGWFRKEAMIPSFANVAFATQPGTIAGKPVQTQFGWHVVYVEAKDDAHIPAFAEVEEALRTELSQQVIQGYLKDLRASASIDVKEAKPAEPEAATPAQPAAGAESDAQPQE